MMEPLPLIDRQPTEEEEAIAAQLVCAALVREAVQAIANLGTAAEKIDMLRFFRDELRRHKLANPAPPGGDVARPPLNRAQRRLLVRGEG